MNMMRSNASLINLLLIRLKMMVVQILQKNQVKMISRDVGSAGTHLHYQKTLFSLLANARDLSDISILIVSETGLTSRSRAS